MGNTCAVVYDDHEERDLVTQGAMKFLVVM